MLEFIEIFTIALFKRDPCRNCLIKPCCSEQCDTSKKFNGHLGMNPFMVRVSSWLLVLLVFIELPWLILTLIYK